MLGRLTPRLARSLATIRMSSTTATRSRSPVLQHLESAVTQLTPLQLADSSWDNVGLMVEAPEPRQSQGKQHVMLCIDLTTSVCDEALSDPNTACILTYHPPIFSGLKSFTTSNPLQRSLLRCIAQGVSVFCIHTAADNALGGVNDFMASGLLDAAGGKGSVEPIKQAQNAPEGHNGAGTGRIVSLSEGLSQSQAVQAVKKTLGREHIQAAWADQGADTIKTVAICAGSGESVLRGVKADLYLTGELGHHSVLSFNAQGIHCLVCNHSATERPWLSEFAPRLQKAMNESADSDRYVVNVSKKDREPLQVV